ncbi:uncharacterized protein [Rutidosis leptorrhynchoides]|uniref:uncharacterized protein n=1 Tax=Rutidosis leptorrhynchoides TaxID=125765 RepID=UPI003A9A3499
MLKRVKVLLNEFNGLEFTSIEIVKVQPKLYINTTLWSTQDALGRQGFNTIQKCTSSLRQLAYGTTTDIYYEYLQMSEGSDIARLYSAHEERYGFKAGVNNNVNILNQSPLLDDIKIGSAPLAPFNVNSNNYTNGYYLADGIYPDWETLIKAYSTPADEPRAKFKRFQENAREDVERTFGVFQGRFHILQTSGRAYGVNKMRRILYCFVLMNNMIVGDNSPGITWIGEELLRTDEANPNFVRNQARNRVTREKEI